MVRAGCANRRAGRPTHSHWLALADHAEADVVRGKMRKVERARGRAEARDPRFPASPAEVALGAENLSARIDPVLAFVRLETIEAPLEDVAGHVFDTERTRAFRETADGRGLGEAVVDQI